MSAATRVYAVRMSVNLVEKIDAYGAMRARVDGRPCTRSDALRLLIEQGLALEMPAQGPAFETPAGAESISGLVTDSFELPPPAAKKKQQPPHRRQDRMPGVAFNRATERIDSKKKR